MHELYNGCMDYTVDADMTKIDQTDTHTIRLILISLD